MTYCLGIVTQFGLVMAADSRTNAGVDYISTYRKLFDFSLPGERVILMCTSGNLSITQAVISGLRKDIKVQNDINLHTLPNLYEIARHIGSKTRQILDQDRVWLQNDGIDFTCNFLVGGQVKGEDPELYLVYSQGNCIQATAETPFLQIGETKYGKPILDRILTFQTSVEAAAKCALVSIDSTMKSNISVGPPITLVMYHANSFIVQNHLELPLGDPYLAKIRKLWGASINQAFESMPDIEWKRNVSPEDEQIEID
ncbi:proteasome-type protease [Desertifilum sp. FACHB-1129]|uniref:Peptidase n=1 Tax=Desertifilum tharense IPPAS B-1220 TaxID=1781255 RepID=A0A1E5QKQ5_9CYAN|nr:MULTISPECIES: proteasome-type protease [Desertifilum]MCD8485376.1 proteasome-type protease [Desertifilum sp.]MDA0209770.1 proteasome-type protease [Cyanobacteria bacterium FC1]MDI9637033.1 proteasome-type protease [Geitlerinema splendidum]MBD2310739.1 proteasome-type protease [Desertifilum sp. FACHB-1129]MBD2320776.1 proteasome-type protease [Desertifilum sp. FACHB-866]